MFEIEKEEATIDHYKEIVDFCFYLKETDVHDDICLLEGTEVIWSKDISCDSRK